MIGMKHSLRLAAFGGLLFAVSVSAQPPAGPGGGGRMRGAGRLRMAVPVEQMLGVLAFDEKMAVTDDQLVKVRHELAGVLAERDSLSQEMRGGDRQAVMQKVQALRKDMFDKLAGVLTADQNKLLQDYIQRMEEVRQRFRQGGGRMGRQGRGPAGQ